MRKGYSDKLFNLKVRQGLSPNRIGNTDIAETIKPTDIENLDFISRGTIPPNPSNLHMGDRLSNLII